MLAQLHTKFLSRLRRGVEEVAECGPAACRAPRFLHAMLVYYNVFFIAEVRNVYNVYNGTNTRP